MQLPCDQMKAELSRLGTEHGRGPAEGTMHAAWNAEGLACVVVEFPDGMRWEVPFDAEAQDIIRSAYETKH